MSDISAMPAGAEMDALIATKVMGWTSSPAEGALLTDPHTHWRGPLVPPVRFLRIDAWKPSTNIAHAWEVVERFTAQNKRVTIQWCTTDRLYRVWIDGGLPVEDANQCVAIARASLLAVSGATP